jgi:homoserine kinase type II
MATVACPTHVREHGDDRDRPAANRRSAELGGDELRVIGTQFGLDVRSGHRLPGGVENGAFRVHAPTGDVVLLELTRRTPESAATYAAYLDALAAAGVPTPPPLVSRGGGFVVVHDGVPVIALPFVAGASSLRLTDGQLSAVGALLADIHGSGVRCPLRPQLRFSEQHLLATAAIEDAALADWLLSSHARVAGVMTEVSMTTVPTHGDPFPDNLLVLQDGSLVLLDWEDGAQDSGLIDLGMAMLGHCNKDGLQVRRARQILDGYRSRSMSPVDPDALLAITTYVALFTAFNRYRRRAEAWTKEPQRSHRAAQRFVASLPATWPRLFDRAVGTRRRDRPPAG